MYSTQLKNNLTTAHSPIKCTVKGIYESLNHQPSKWPLFSNWSPFDCFKHLEKPKNHLYFIEYGNFFLVIKLLWKKKKSLKQNILANARWHATSKDSDQPVHPCSLISVIADCMCLLHVNRWSFYIYIYNPCMLFGYNILGSIFKLLYPKLCYDELC